MTATTTPTIEEILDEFLDQQEARLSPATFRKYASTVELLWMHLNGYGHEGLSEAEAKRFERAFEDGDEEAFCHLFGPEKIVEQIPRFLYWFVLRKVMARESELRRRQHLAQARALARRAELRHREDAELALEAAASARDDLPAADRLSTLLHDHTGGMFGPKPPREGARVVEDYLTIERAEPGALCSRTGLDRSTCRTPPPSWPSRAGACGARSPARTGAGGCSSTGSSTRKVEAAPAT
jgi:hypothetical protein